MKKIFKFSICFFGILLLINLGWWGNDYYKSKLNINPDPISYIKQKPLEKYSIENLSNTKISSVDIKIEKELKKEDDFTSNLISFSFDPTLSGKIERKVTGLVNIPQKDGPFPLIILFRGFVDQKIYETGMGTKRVGEFFAKNGFLTIAPDFLGYAGSDSEAENIFESRFQTYTTALALLKSINKTNFPNWDGENIYIWAHSNGGQIALTALEISSVSYPTVLWAPVTKPFPYSVLYYTDESEDHGKLIRRELAKFENNYDVEKYSLTNYLDKIKAPITIFQGINDDAVPVNWSNSFVKLLKNLGIKTNYFIYPKADHNMNPVWGDVIVKTLESY